MEDSRYLDTLQEGWQAEAQKSTMSPEIRNQATSVNADGRSSPTEQPGDEPQDWDDWQNATDISAAIWSEARPFMMMMSAGGIAVYIHPLTWLPVRSKVSTPEKMVLDHRRISSTIPDHC